MSLLRHQTRSPEQATQHNIGVQGQTAVSSHQPPCQPTRAPHHTVPLSSCCPATSRSRLGCAHIISCLLCLGRGIVSSASGLLNMGEGKERRQGCRTTQQQTGQDSIIVLLVLAQKKPSVLTGHTPAMCLSTSATPLPCVCLHKTHPCHANTS